MNRTSFCTFEENIKLENGTIDVWFYNLDRPLPEIKVFEKLLSYREKDRA